MPAMLLARQGCAWHFRYESNLELAYCCISSVAVSRLQHVCVVSLKMMLPALYMLLSRLSIMSVQGISREHSSAVQVVVDKKRGGALQFVGCNNLQLPARFYCWPSLAINQLLFPSASLSGPLCGILAGVLGANFPWSGALAFTPLHCAYLLQRGTNTPLCLHYTRALQGKEAALSSRRAAWRSTGG